LFGKHPFQNYEAAMTRSIQITELNSRVIRTRNDQTGAISQFAFTIQHLDIINSNPELRAVVASYLDNNGWFVSNPVGFRIFDDRFVGTPESTPTPLGTSFATFNDGVIVDGKPGSYINLGSTDVLGFPGFFTRLFSHEIAHFVLRRADAFFHEVASRERTLESAVTAVFGAEARATALEMQINSHNPNYLPHYISFAAPAPLMNAFNLLKQSMAAEASGDFAVVSSFERMNNLMWALREHGPEGIRGTLNASVQSIMSGVPSGAPNAPLVNISPEILAAARGIVVNMSPAQYASFRYEIGNLSLTELSAILQQKQMSNFSGAVQSWQQTMRDQLQRVAGIIELPNGNYVQDPAFQENSGGGGAILADEIDLVFGFDAQAHLSTADAFNVDLLWQKLTNETKPRVGDHQLSSSGDLNPGHELVMQSAIKLDWETVDQFYSNESSLRPTLADTWLIESKPANIALFSGHLSAVSELHLLRVNERPMTV
jgi:hypothetical protein